MRLCFILLVSLASLAAQPTVNYVPAVKAAAPAIVNISAEQVVESSLGDIFDNFMSPLFDGLKHKEIARSLGSGVIVSPDGIVVTCFHVVRDARRIKVRLHQGNVYDAEVVVTDEQNDLAAIRLKGDKPEGGFPSVSLGNSDTLEEGQPIFAVGWPFAVGRFTTHGIISNPSVRIHNRLLVGTDAPINPGNSGGGVFDLEGKLMAIANAIISRSGASNGVGFAIPVNLVGAVLDAYQKGLKQVVRPWVGVSVQTIDDEMKESLRLKGVLVRHIHPLSPVMKAGLAQGDVITAVNGEAIYDEESFRFRLQTMSDHDTITFKINKVGKESELTFKGIAPPKEPAPVQTAIRESRLLRGIVVANLSPDLAIQLGADATQEGVVVIKVLPGARAAFLRVGDILHSFDDERIRDVADLLQKLRRLRQFSLNIKRDQDMLTLQVN